MKTRIKLGLFTLGLCVGGLPIALIATSCGRDYLDIIDGVRCNFMDDNSIHKELSKDNSKKNNYDVYSTTINDLDMQTTKMALVYNAVMTTLLDVDPTTLSAHFSLDITSQNNAIPEVNCPIQPLSLDKITYKPTYNSHVLTVYNTHSNYMAICLGYTQIYNDSSAAVKTLDLWMYYDIHGLGKYSAEIDTWAFHLSYKAN